MKINYMSDIHTEFDQPAILKGVDNRPVCPGGDLLILAGDIAVKGDTSWVWEQADKYEQVILISGNHEHYHGDITLTADTIEYALPDNTLYLENQSVKLKDFSIHGCTLWGGYNIPGSMMDANRQMNDHRIISDGVTGKFTAERAWWIHNESVKWLEQHVKEGDIVVTHHAPSVKSVDLDRYGDLPINGAYYDNLEWLIEKTKPAVWIHGHVHQTLDYMIGDTRVLCNPRGYVDYEENKEFDVNASFQCSGRERKAPSPP